MTATPAPCSRATPACTFWAWGPGYLRPACCTEHLLELTDFAHRLLAGHGIVHWVDWGTLLGAVREGDLIPWDSDVDFGILEEDAERVRALAPEVARAGFVLKDKGDVAIRIQYGEVNESHLDLVLWARRGELLVSRESDDDIWLGMSGRTAFPARYVERLEPVVLHGRSLPAPSPVHAFLREHRYGEAYLTPTRPPLALGLDESIKDNELTPAASALLPLFAERSERLISLARARSRLMRWGLVDPPATPWGMRWQLVAGLPLGPTPRHLAEAWRHAAADDGPAVGKLVAALAWVERAIEEYERPGLLTPLRRAGRRLARLGLWVTRRLLSRRAPAG